MELRQQSQRRELSPLDGRYKELTECVRRISSERELVKRRITVESVYLLKLVEVLNLHSGFSVEEVEQVINHIKGATSCIDIDRVFEIEKTTKHDVKAVELAFREYLLKLKLSKDFANKVSPFIHFGLTSQDINSVCVTLECKALITDCVIPSCNRIIGELEELASIYKWITMLSHTHGQPATPTTLGLQFGVFAERLSIQLMHVKNHKWTTKFGGATGGFNAHHYVYPNVDWKQFATELLQDSFQIQRQTTTTQIEHYDGLSELFDAIKRINVVLIDFCADIWHYISLGYLKQSAAVGSVGSSTMPHKINPIQFENAEGNLQLANCLLEFMSRKLPISRMQRDLTDSTVTRNIGSAFGYTEIGMANIIRGLKTIAANEQVILADLNAHPEVITEGLQCLMRADGNDRAYETFHKWLRENSGVSLEDIREFVRRECSASVNLDEMLELTPGEYRPQF